MTSSYCMFVCAQLTFSTFPGRVISLGEITRNHPRSHQHPEVLCNLVLAQIYVYALIQLFAEMSAQSSTTKIRSAVIVLYIAGHKHKVSWQTLQTMARSLKVWPFNFLIYCNQSNGTGSTCHLLQRCGSLLGFNIGL